MTKNDSLINAFEILTIGLPFCVFKFLTASYLLFLYKSGAFIWTSSFILFLFFGVDLIFNLGNLISFLTRKKSLFPVCFFSWLAQKIFIHFDKTAKEFTEFGMACDSLMSFALVALMILDGALRTLSPTELYLWNASVILNVLGAGFGRLWQAWGQLIQKR